MWAANCVLSGSPLETKDLVRAGVCTLERAIILSGNGNGSGDQGHMADADALFTYQVLPTCAATSAEWSHAQHQLSSSMHNLNSPLVLASTLLWPL